MTIFFGRSCLFPARLDVGKCVYKRAGGSVHEGKVCTCGATERVVVKKGARAREWRSMHILHGERYVIQMHRLCTERFFNAKKMLIMEPASCDLFSHVEQSGGLPEDETVRLARQIIEAIASCHRHGIAHCDIKLDNIGLIGDVHSVRLLDFGSSMEINNNKVPVGVVGCSPSYRPPELLSGSYILGEALACVDYWELGITIFTMHTGAFPFDIDPKHQTQAEQLKILGKPIRWPKSMSAGMRTAIGGLLMVDPAARVNPCSGDIFSWHK